MSTQELISKEVESLPEALQREVYDFAHFLRLKSKGGLQLFEEFESWEAASDEDFNGIVLSQSALRKDSDTPEEDAAWANL